MAGTPTAEVVYSEDRVRRLRIALRVALGVGVVLAGLAVWILVGVLPDDSGALSYAVLLVVAAVVVLAASGLALRLLPARGRQAKRAAVLTAVVLMPCSVLIGQLGFVTIVLGLVVLFLALIVDEPEPPAPPVRRPAAARTGKARR